MEKKEEFKKAIAQMSDEQLVKYLRILRFSLDEDISQFSHLASICKIHKIFSNPGQLTIGGLFFFAQKLIYSDAKVIGNTL